MSSESIPMPGFPIRIGGHLCLDFTNTAEFRGTEQFVEFLPTYGHLLAWGEQVGILNAQRAAELQVSAAPAATAAEAALQDTYMLREAIYALFSAIIDQQALPAMALSTLNGVLAEALSHRYLATQGTTLDWVWQEEPVPLAHPLWPLALAAVELLTAPQVERVGKCPGCGWLFLDTSRSGHRRWCSMAFCGNKAKSRRQYTRKRGLQG